MSTNICSYEGCMVRRYPCTSIAFFAIPTDNRRHQWIVNSGNKDLEKLDGTRTRLFCEKHFHQSDIRSQFHRKILRKTAIPIPYKNLSSQVVSSRHLTEVDPSMEIIEEDALVTEHEKLPKCKDIVVACTLEIAPGEDSDDEITHEMLSYTDQDVELIEETLEECESNNRTLQDVHLVTSMNEEEIILEDDEALEPEARVTTTTNTEKELVDEMVERQPIEIVPQSTNSISTIGGNEIQSSSDSTYDDDKHFALSLVGYFQRLKHEKKVVAKLKILTYLTALDLGEKADL